METYRTFEQWELRRIEWLEANGYSDDDVLLDDDGNEFVLAEVEEGGQVIYQKLYLEY